MCSSSRRLLNFTSPMRVAISLLCLVVLCNAADIPLHSGKQLSEVPTILRHMSLEEKVGQMLQIRVYADDASVNNPDYITARRIIRTYHIGSVDLSAHQRGPNLVKGLPTTVGQVLNQLQRESALPLLVGSDLERGVAPRVANAPEFPFPMSFGATGNLDFSERFGSITGREARAVGIHWAYAPVADVSTTPTSVVGNRSFGESAEAVSDFVAAFIRGAHRANLIVAAKHFPGEGESSDDPHVQGEFVGADVSRLQHVEFPPFERAIAVGVDSVLVGHAHVPALETDPNRVATTSPKILEGVLRSRLGFKGVIITDALEMQGLTLLYPSSSSPTREAALDAVRAGADVLMVPTDLDGAYWAIINAVKDGTIAERRLDDSVSRILQLKAKLGLFNNRFVDLNSIQKTFHDPMPFAMAQRVADDSVTLVKNQGNLLPFKRVSRGASSAKHHTLVLILADSTRSPMGRNFEHELRLRQPDAKILHSYYDNLGSDVSPGEMHDLLSNSDAVIVAVFLSHLPGRQRVVGGRIMNLIALGGSSQHIIQETLAQATNKAIVIAFGNPYLIGLYPNIANYVCTYSPNQTSEISAAKALFGEISNHAKLPVTLPGVAPRGFSIPWPVAPPQRTQIVH